MLKYEGEKLLKKVEIEHIITLEDASTKVVKETLFPYIADPELIKSINLAILLQRPLLLMGEPGCGKTRVAKVVAFELYHQQQGELIEQDYLDYYFEWNIKSTSKAQEGLYQFDAIRRLGEAQILSAQVKQGASIDVEKSLNKKDYISLGPMGKAFKKSVDASNRAVLLIDEIDKADIDFPNDLLNELDNGYFTIPETGEKVVAEEKPIVLITSNAEKDLPDAFLRRCLYHYIKPFDDKMFFKIINSRFYQLDSEVPHNDLVKTAVKQFIEIRDQIKEQIAIVGKPISTSELIDWYEALQHYTKLKEKDEERSKSIELLIKELEKVGKKALEIPFRQVLFKNWNTLTAFDKS